MTAAILFAALAHMPVEAPFENGLFDVSTGDKFTYKTTTTSETDSSFGSFTTTTTQVRTIEVVGKPGGWFRIQITVDEHEIKSDSPGPMGELSEKGLVTSFDVSPVRKMRNWKLEDEGDVTKDAADLMRDSKKITESNGFQGLILPDTELKVGTTWKYENLPTPTAFGGMEAEVDGKLSVECTVVGFEGTGARGTVVISAETSGDYSMVLSSDQGEFEMDMTVKVEAKYWVRLSDGVVTKIESELESDMSFEYGDATTTTKVKTELTSG